MLKVFKITAAFAVLMMVFSSSAALTQEYWPKKHKDPGNTAYQGNADDSPGFGLDLSWTYPWPSVDYKNDERIINDADAEFSTSGSWVQSNTLPIAQRADDAYNDEYHYVRVKTPDNTVAAASATWTVPATAEQDNYTVYVWFPSSTSSISNTGHATYTINSMQGTYRVTIAQSNGGQWVQLGSRYRLGPGSTVTLSNLSEARQQTVGPNPDQPTFVYVDDGKFAIADAIRFVKDNGQIYSSPAVFAPDSGRTFEYGADRGVVFGVIDRDPFSRRLGNSQVSWGSIVCVDAYNGPGRQGNPNNTERDRPIWRYPQPDSSKRDPLEGPIAAGAYSSPLVVDTPQGRTVIIGADDGQLYALDAVTGKLRWSGPGVTLDDASALGVTSSGFTPAGASDPATGKYATFFGSDYLVSAASASGTNSVTYQFTNLPDYYYDIYAWIPPPSGGLAWVTDALYRITYHDPGQTSQAQSQLATDEIRVNQSGCGGNLVGARWVRVGSSYLPDLGKITVTVTNNSSSTINCEGGALTVVADAVKLVPAGIGPFGYCAPSAQTLSGVERIFAANNAGRIFAVDTRETPANSARISWIYPKVRTNSGEFDEQPLGAMSSTPAVFDDSLIYTTTSGGVGRINGINGSAPTMSWDRIEGKDGTIIDLGSVTASPMVDGGYVYFGTSRGKLYKSSLVGSAGTEDDTQKVSKVIWTFPEEWPSLGKQAVGAFRHSAPAKAVVNGVNYVVAASQDGVLYQVPADGPASANSPREIQSVGSMSSSPATVTKLGAEPEAAYVGTNSGLVMGFNLDSTNTSVQTWGWSTLGDSVFSSPAAAAHWVYAGAEDGRMYAFVKTGAGGYGPGWPTTDPTIPSEPPGGQYDPNLSGGSAYLDLDVITKEFYDYLGGFQYDDWKTSKDWYHLSRSLIDGSNRKNLRPPFASSGRLEWGETIYLVGWTFAPVIDPDKNIVATGNRNASIIFELHNTGEGEVAGSLIRVGQAANREYPPPPSGRSRTYPDDYAAVTINGTTQYGLLYWTRFAYTLEPTKLLTPGAGYTIRASMTARIRRQGQTSDTTMALSTSVALDPSVPVSGGSTRPPLTFAINNPMAIGFESPAYSAEWPGIPGQRFTPTRTDPGTAYNGMTSLVRQVVPDVKHGANSNPLYVHLADRSMIGFMRLPGIRTLRADRGDLNFRGPAVNLMPWERDPTGFVNTSLDYPDLPKTRLSIRKELDGSNPTSAPATLMPTTSPAGDTDGSARVANPDPLVLVLDVPKYQPPSTYGTGCSVWIDAREGGCEDGRLDVADRQVTGTPLRGSEVYREWHFVTEVPPDVNMFAAERTIDLGKRPIGFGMWPNLADFLPFSGYTVPPNYPSSNFFQTFTIHNDGNVNVSGLRLFKERPLFSDQVNAIDYNANGILENNEGHALSGANLVSSLDMEYIGLGIPSAMPVFGKGYVISKPRVGAFGPTRLTMPDERQRDALMAADPNANVPEPALPMVSVRIPIGTPSGTYSQVVPIVADMTGAGLGTWFTNPAFTVKVNVREARMTDGVTAGSLPQIDSPANLTPLPGGDAQPAAVKLWQGTNGIPVDSGPISIMWSSNRTASASPRPDEPWYLYQSLLLGLDATSSPVKNAGQWWQRPNMVDPIGILSGTTPSDLFPSSPGQGLPGTIIPETVRYTSPSYSQNPQTGETWAVFMGQADKRDGGFVRSEYRLFYARVNFGNGLVEQVRSITNQDFTTPKLNPRILVAPGNGSQSLYVFWNGSPGGSQKLFFNYNADSSDPNGWSRDALLTLPNAITAASSPSAMLRDLPPPTGGTGGGRAVDVVYSGISRHGGGADLFLTRFTPNGSRLNVAALPRVFGEELKRDTQGMSLFSAAHLGWVRPGHRQNPGSAGSDNWPKILVFRTGESTPDVLTNVPAIVDAETGMVVYENLPAVLEERYGRLVIDTSAGTVKFGRPISSSWRVVAEYTPQTWRITSSIMPVAGAISRSNEPRVGSLAFLEKTLKPGSAVDRNILPPGSGPMRADRMWIFWRQRAGAVGQNTIYYKTMRLGLQLRRPVAIGTNGSPVSLVVNDGPANYAGMYEFDWTRNRLYFTEQAEGRAITVTYRTTDGSDVTEPAPSNGLSWITEVTDRAMPVDAMVNEGQIYAFADPDGLRDPVSDPRYRPSLVWVFWSSTRDAGSDIYYQTLSPNFRAVSRP